MVTCGGLLIRPVRAKRSARDNALRPNHEDSGGPRHVAGRAPRLLAVLLLAASALVAQRGPARAPSPYDLKYPPLRPIELPKAASFTLSNGMKLLLLEEHDVPVIRGEARIRTGNVFDPADKIGLATLTGIVLRTGGTRQMKGDELDRKLEDMAANVESSIGETDGRVSFFSLAANSSEALALFHDVLTEPVFRADQIELGKIQVRGMIAKRNEDAANVAEREFHNLVYGQNTPYGWNIGYEPLDRIHRSDLQAFYKRYYFPKNIVLAISGDFDAAKMKDQVEQLFGAWKAEQPPVTEFPKVAATPRPGVYLAKNTDLEQPQFVMGHLGGLMSDKDYAPLTVMATILGGSSTSRLATQVKGRTGDVFTISAQWSGGLEMPGLFEITGMLKPVPTVPTLKAIIQEVDRLRTGDVSEEEVRAAKDRALSSLIFSADTDKKILASTLNLAYAGYPVDFPREHQKVLAAVTRADVQRVAKAYLRPADFTIVVVGNPNDFVPGLETMGPVQELDLTIPEPKAQPAPTDTASIEQGKQILARLQQAMGGADKMALVKDYTVIRDVHFSAQAGGADTVETEKWMSPSHIREESQNSAGSNALYCDGHSGWTARGRSSNALRGPQLKAVQDDAFRSYFALLLSDRIEGRTVNALDSDLVEITSADGQAVQVAVDPATGLPLQFSYQAPAPSGPPVLVQETFTKFGEAGGLKVPLETSIKRNGTNFADTVVKEFKVNTGMVLADLERRP